MSHEAVTTDDQGEVAYSGNWRDYYSGHGDALPIWHLSGEGWDYWKDEHKDDFIEAVRSVLTEFFAMYGVGLAGLADQVPYTLDPWMEPPKTLSESTLSFSLGNDCVDDTFYKSYPLPVATVLLPVVSYTRKLTSCEWNTTVFDMTDHIVLREIRIGGISRLTRWVWEEAPYTGPEWSDWV